MGVVQLFLCECRGHGHIIVFFIFVLGTDGMYALAMSHLTGYGGAAHDAEMAVKMLVKICDHFVHPSAQLRYARNSTSLLLR